MYQIARRYEVVNDKGEVLATTTLAFQLTGDEAAAVTVTICDVTYAISGKDTLDALVKALFFAHTRLSDAFHGNSLRWVGGEGIGFAIEYDLAQADAEFVSTLVPAFHHWTSISIGLAHLEGGAVDAALKALHTSMSLLPLGELPDTRLAEELRARGISSETLDEWDAFVRSRS